MNTNRLTAWLLLDDRPGHQTQVLGVAKALGSLNEIIPLQFNRLSALPLWPSLLGINKGSREALAPPYPDVVIAAGRKTIPVARWIKKRSPKSCVVQLMWPGRAYAEYDLIAMPEHDALTSEDTRIMTTLGAPHALTAKILDQAKAAWQERLQSYEKPIGVLIGGKSKHGTLRMSDAKEMANCINAHPSALITTSRRTPSEFITALKEAITVPHMFYAYGDAGENPYHAILACSEALLVTGDSMSMVCEARYLGKPTEIYAPGHLCGPKHLRLHKALNSHTGTLDEASRVAAEIKRIVT